MPFQIHTDFLDYSVTRLYLRNPEDLSSAGFLIMSASVKETGSYVNLALDVETGRALALELRSSGKYPFEASPRELGEAVLDRLGLAYELEYSADTSACFRLAECVSEFWFIKEERWLSFQVQLDWEAAEAGTMAEGKASGMDKDAVSMQKW